MIYDEITKIIKNEGIIIQDIEKLQFVPNSVFLNQLSISPSKFGQSASIEMWVFDSDKENVENLYQRIENILGTKGTFGEYKVKRITYSPENPKEALDKIWAIRCLINLIMEV